ncbi:MAG: cation:proton antiporter [Campylobacterota bacterium]|nr:cation:proton antiporter [Campylobacterota bacterium]
MQTLFYIGIIFVLGAFMEWLSPKVGLPKVVGYLLLGLIIGPEILGVIPEHFIQETHIIIDLALSLIAVLVGANLKYSTLKGMGKQIISITFFEAAFAFLFVSIGLYLLSGFLGFPIEQSLIISILFGGLASATAPAATIAVVHELKAKGRFTSTLLAVVASDDALALIFFTFAVTLGSIFSCNGDFSLTTLFDMFSVIALSAVVGMTGAFISEMIDKLFAHHKGMETISTIGMIFIVFSLSSYWQLEPLLATLVMGVVMTNISNDFELVEEEIDNHLEEIIFMLFFILSAMHLDLSTLSAMPFVILAYILFRFLGKISGVWIGSKMTKADKNVQNYLGLGLFPQAGVAIGLALSLQDQTGFESIAPLILNVIIATTVVHEFIGPLFIKYILRKTGECGGVRFP